MLFHLTLKHPAEQCPADCEALPRWLANAEDTLEARAILWGAGCLLFGQGPHAAYIVLEADDAPAAIHRVREQVPADWQCEAEAVWRLPDDLPLARQTRAALTALTRSGSQPPPEAVRTRAVEFPIVAARSVELLDAAADQAAAKGDEPDDEEQHTLLLATPAVPPAASPAPPRLVLISQGQLDGQYQVGPEGVTLGRAPSNSIRLSDERVSGKHVAIEWRGDGFWLTDLGSTNGTRLNGERLTAPHRLVDGDLIQVGRTDLVARLDG